MNFQPDYRHFTGVMNNTKPSRLPLYEHIISFEIMEKILDVEFAGLFEGTPADVSEFFRHYCEFFSAMTYDTVSFEVCITDVLPGHGALSGGMKGPIQNRADFETYPWDNITELYRNHAAGKLDALAASLPPGMKAVGGVGNGVFEISEDLVGLECLPFLKVDDPELYHDLFVKIGDMIYVIWSWFLPRYGDSFAACRMGDDLGFKSSLLTNPATVRGHIFPQYSRIIDLIHSFGIPFIWHSCGCIFEVMEDAIALGIDAKHSNEDAIAPFARWIDSYGGRIGLLGGFDMDFLGRHSPEEVFERVSRLGREYRNTAHGYALGSGNSIPDFIPVDNYLAMIRAAQAIRSEE